MTNKNIFKTKFLISIIFLIFAIFALMVVMNKNQPHQDSNQTPKVEFKLDVKDEDLAKLTVKQKQLFEQLKSAAQQENYEDFAKNLKEIYQNQWESLKPFQAVESALYVLATDKYFIPKNFNESLRISSIVYKDVPMSWRFRYLKIVSLERLGRAALEKNDLTQAEKYALDILSMMYRIEGANLLADIYIKKIKDALVKKNKNAALEALNFIWDYEVGADRRNTLNDLKNQISKL